MIDVKILDPNKVKIDKKSYENFLIYHIGYVIFKDLSYTTSSSVNPLCLINNEINGYIEESNGSKYLSLVPIDESKGTRKV